MGPLRLQKWAAHLCSAPPLQEVGPRPLQVPQRENRLAAKGRGSAWKERFLPVLLLQPSLAKVPRTATLGDGCESARAGPRTASRLLFWTRSSMRFARSFRSNPSIAPTENGGGELCLPPRS